MMLKWNSVRPQFHSCSMQKSTTMVIVFLFAFFTCTCRSQKRRVIYYGFMSTFGLYHHRREFYDLQKSCILKNIYTILSVGFGKSSLTWMVLIASCVSSYRGVNSSQGTLTAWHQSTDLILFPIRITYNINNIIN